MLSWSMRAVATLNKGESMVQVCPTTRNLRRSDSGTAPAARGHRSLVRGSLVASSGPVGTGVLVALGNGLPGELASGRADAIEAGSRR